jgi:hypothetical protein
VQNAFSSTNEQHAINKNDRSFNISSNSKEKALNFFKSIDFNIQKILQIELKQLEMTKSDLFKVVTSLK